MDISKHHKSVYIVCLLALVIQAALSCFYAFSVAAVYVKWTPDSAACGTTGGGSCSSATVAGLVFYCTFAYLWTSQVVGNVALATLAGGAYGGWYYYGPAYEGKMPKHPNWKAFVRASTLSLGSIAFGSLIVTLLELLRMLFNVIQQNARADGNGVCPPAPRALWKTAADDRPPSVPRQPSAPSSPASPRAASAASRTWSPGSTVRPLAPRPPRSPRADPRRPRSSTARLRVHRDLPVRQGLHPGRQGHLAPHEGPRHRRPCVCFPSRCHLVRPPR